MKQNIAVWAALMLAVSCFGLRAQQKSGSSAPPPMKVEAHLVWGTNDKQSPDPNHKPVNAEVKKALLDLPLKWENYFEVNKLTVEVPAMGSQKVAMSKKCEIEIHDLGKSRIEVLHFGNGKQDLKRTQAFGKGETFVIGGNAPNATSWFVVLKRLN
jgi:hypothetical protein